MENQNANAQEDSGSAVPCSHLSRSEAPTTTSSTGHQPSAPAAPSLTLGSAANLVTTGLTEGSSTSPFRLEPSTETGQNFYLSHFIQTETGQNFYSNTLTSTNANTNLMSCYPSLRADGILGSLGTSSLAMDQQRRQPLQEPTSSSRSQQPLAIDPEPTGLLSHLRPTTTGQDFQRQLQLAYIY